ncbi:hypothetical protein ACFZB6_11145 [Streptomyces syringium]|uniref:hypothetical protein n=1 Tax=Streptomyces syringium TaxID=76729 RepID=UPI0033AA6949
MPLVLPVLPAGAMLYGLNRAPWETEASAVRPAASWWMVALAAASALSVLVALLETLLLDFSLAFAVARNFLGYLGVGLIVQRFTHAQYGSVAVAVLPVACALIGLGPGGRPYAWMWPLHASDSLVAGALAVIIFGLGLAATTRYVSAYRSRR